MIQFCKTTLGEEEIKAITDVIRSGWVMQGKITKEFEEKFAEYVGAKYAVFVDSGTSALLLSLECLKRHGKLFGHFPLTVPSLTFVSTAEAPLNAGFNILFGDVGDDLCLADVNETTLPVHLTGNKAKEGALIYDSAHRVTRGDVNGSKALWCYSLYATKNLTTINGGMIATNNEDYARWLRRARDHGISKGTTERYKEGAWEYSIDFLGYREKSDDVHAAIGIEQLKKLPEMDEKRERIISKYNKGFGLSRTGLHLYPILVEERREFLEDMTEQGIQCSVHFLPLNKMPAFETRYSLNAIPLPKTKYFGERLVSLPLYPQLNDSEVNYIIEKVEESGLRIQK